MYVIHEGIADPDRNVGTVAMRSTHTNDETVEFHPDTGKAQVRKAVGESLCEHFDDIVPAEEDD